jgi:hypothetical protein
MPDKPAVQPEPKKESLGKKIINGLEDVGEVAAAIGAGVVDCGKGVILAAEEILEKHGSEE